MTPEKKIEHKFAWIPVLIRNNSSYGAIKVQYWVWLKRYTRMSSYDIRLGRFRTYDTVLGHVSGEK